MYPVCIPCIQHCVYTIYTYLHFYLNNFYQNAIIITYTKTRKQIANTFPTPSERFPN